MRCLFPLYAGVLRDGSTGDAVAYKRAKDGHKYDRLYFFNSREERERAATGCPFGIFLDALDLPCGQCFACRLNYSQHWATRLTAEALYHEYNYFLTLTYNDDNLPHSDLGFATLKPDHVSAFMKRLRRHYEYNYGIQNIRFFAAGEYGTTTYRPHYHLVVFGLPLDDLKYYKVNFRGDAFFTSPTLERLWGKGFVVVGEMCYDSAAYVARYCTKKLTGDAQVTRMEQFGQVQEFSRMSLKPGLGFQYFIDKHLDIYDYDKVLLPGVHAIRPPAYYDHLFEDLMPAKYDDVKAHRIMRGNLVMQNILSRTDLTYEQYLEGLRLEAEQTKKKLPRDLL